MQRKSVMRWKYVFSNIFNRKKNDIKAAIQKEAAKVIEELSKTFGDLLDVDFLSVFQPRRIMFRVICVLLLQCPGKVLRV